jgi:hypothetical protein
MSEELSGVTRLTVDRTQRDFPRRDSSQQQGNRRPPAKQPAPAVPAAAPSDDPPAVGSRLNVRA